MSTPDTFKRISIPQVGDTSVLRYEDNVPTSNLTEGDSGAFLLVKAAYAGINFIDTYYRSGLYTKPLPFTSGSEGSGIVVGYGPSVDDALKEKFPVGTKVAYYSCDTGSYASLVKVQSHDAFVLPASFDLKAAAALLLQGLTAHYLTHDTFPVKEGSVVLVHAAAGGTGLLITQMAKARGASLVIGVCGGAEKAEAARTIGKCDAVVDYKATPEWEKEVIRITGGAKCHVVYDGVGRSTFAGSLSSLRPRGMMVSFGNASGAVEPMAPLVLSAHGSLFLTRPKLGDYMLSEEEREARVADLVSLVVNGSITLTITTVLPLEQAAEAHKLLESQQTRGKILLQM